MIRVIDDWVITSDGSQYILGKMRTLTNRNTGEQYEAMGSFSYYPTFSSALMAVSRRLRAEAIKEADGTLKDACEAIRYADERLIGALSIFDEIKIERSELPFS